LCSCFDKPKINVFATCIKLHNHVGNTISLHDAVTCLLCHMRLATTICNKIFIMHSTKYNRFATEKNLL